MKPILHSTVLLMAASTLVMATNGDHLIAVGAKARGMGGIGIGMSHGAETALSNPALITSLKGTEISFGGTLFMPNVSTNMGGGYSSSEADLSVIPEVAVAGKVSDELYLGVGMFGTAGMGTDYRHASGATANMNMVTNLQLMQFAVPVAYKTAGLSIGIAPVLQYGSLEINYAAPNFTIPSSTTQGVAQDLGVGYNIGLAYETDGITVGAVYKSAIDMKYDGQLSAATGDFAGVLSTEVLSDHLEQPAEMGVGLSYKMGEHTFAVDYKQIQWGSAKGYKNFGWEDQDVYAVGYEYGANGYTLRVGYNHANNPIKQHTADTQGSLYNMLNLLGFPAIVEDHYTAGGTYNISKTTSVDLAYVYVPEETVTYDVSGLGGGMTTVSTKHSQQTVSAQVNFNF